MTIITTLSRVTVHVPMQIKYTDYENQRKKSSRAQGGDPKCEQDTPNQEPFPDAPCRVIFRISDRQSKTAHGTDDFKRQRKHCEAVNIGQMTLKRKSGEAETRTTCRLHRPDHSHQHGQPTLHHRIAAHPPESGSGGTYNGHSPQIVDDLDERINKILHHDLFNGHRHRTLYPCHCVAGRCFLDYDDMLAGG